MKNRKIYQWAGVACMALAFAACTPKLVTKTENTDIIPESFNDSQDSTNTAKIGWKEFFTDPYLTALIDTALSNNQELNIIMQEIQIARNEVRARKGEYLPTVGIGAAADVEKVGRYTSKGSSEATTDIKPGRSTPDPLPNYGFGAYATWEVDIWRKLRNAKKSAYTRYLSSVDGRNFMVTNLIAEIANSYYELLALDNQLAILQQNIEIQNNAYEMVKLQKQASRVTELAVRRFEAHVLYTKSLQYGIRQKIVETENRINFLVGRYPQPIERNHETFGDLIPATIAAGIPSQLLENRPDIRQAEMQLTASKLDVKVAKAQFYPNLSITAGIGFEAFNPTYLIKSPESLLYSLAGDLTAPLINRNAIKAAYYSANSKQIQAVYNYERTILNAYIEVANQMSSVSNLQSAYSLKEQQVNALNESINISNFLFKSARADYMEVLLTQRDALESRFELIETKKEQMNTMVNIYRALGGGWKE
ncbi:TolC family protein [Reichenbachiella agarivorans]|uniref:TolC family protein n=1 Tax=Reichenbachiella agarivorans TaxID=2979464 RepID=A0ABY6CL23_9BACT|nr:TolC family protein [Reichenbachiella agarivorans]UXP31218.1 TolC family protein [Reichenbachiella agarivorans]